MPTLNINFLEERNQKASQGLENRNLWSQIHWNCLFLEFHRQNEYYRHFDSSFDPYYCVSFLAVEGNPIGIESKIVILGKKQQHRNRLLPGFINKTKIYLYLIPYFTLNANFLAESNPMASRGLKNRNSQLRVQEYSEVLRGWR